MARNELEIILRLRDQATRALKSAQRAIKGLEGELKRAKDAARALNRQLEDAAPYSFGLAKAAGVAAGAMGGLGIKALSVAGQFEQMRIAFTTMLGDAEKADRFLRELYDFAAKTPFEIEGLQQQVQLLLALGFKAEEVIPTLRAVGDAVAALGGSSELLDRVVLALGQIRAKGKVSAEEMRQLAEAGIPAWEMLAKKIGTDIPTAMKLAEQGAIDAATGVSALLEGMQARFSGMMERQSQTLLGIWSNIKDNLTRTLAALGDQIDKTFHVREGMQSFLDWLNKVRAWFEEGGLQRALRSSKELIIGLAGAIAGALTPAIVQAARGLALFVARLAPWALAGYAAVRVLEALGVSLTDLKRWAALGAQALVGLTKVGQAVVEDFSGIVAFWRSALGGVIDAYHRALFFLDRAWKAIKDKNIEGARFALQTAAAAVTSSMKQAFDQAANESAGFFDRANKLAEDGLTKILETVDGTLGDVAEKVKAAFGDIEEKAKSASQTIVKLAKGANAPLPSLANGYQAAGDAAKKAAEKVKDFNDELKRQLGLLGQRSPREATGGPYTATVNEPGHGDIAGRNAGLIPPSYGGRGARRGGGGVLAEQRRRYREQLRAIRQEFRAEQAALRADVYEHGLGGRAAVAAARRAARNAARAMRNVLKGEAADTGVVTWDQILEGLKREMRRRKRELKHLIEIGPGEGVSPNELEAARAAIASRATKAERDRRRAAKEVYEWFRKQREELEKQVQAAEQFVDTLSSVYSGVDRIFRSFGEVGKNTGQAIRDLWSGFSDVAKSIPVIGGLLSKVFDFFGKLEQGLYKLTWQATVESLKRAESAYQKLGDQMVLINQRAFASVKKYQERFLFGLISVDRYKVEIDKFAMSIAQTLEQGVLGGLRNAMKAFLEGAQDWQDQLKEGLRSAIENAVIEAVIKGTIIKGALGDMLTNLTQALAKGNYDAAREYVRQIAAAVPDLTQKIAGVLEPFRRAMAGLRSGDREQASNAAPGIQTIRYELPSAPVLAAPAWVDRMGEHVDRFGKAVDRFAKTKVQVDVSVADSLAWSVRGVA